MKDTHTEETGALAESMAMLAIGYASKADQLRTELEEEREHSASLAREAGTNELQRKSAEQIESLQSIGTMQAERIRDLVTETDQLRKRLDALQADYDRRGVELATLRAKSPHNAS